MVSNHIDKLSNHVLLNHVHKMISLSSIARLLDHDVRPSNARAIHLSHHVFTLCLSMNQIGVPPVKKFYHVTFLPALALHGQQITTDHVDKLSNHIHKMR